MKEKPGPVTVTVHLEHCEECRHYTPYGKGFFCAPEGSENWPFEVEQIKGKLKKIPSWCPLKHGYGY